MTNEMKSVPELRFLQFDKEWEKTTIADIGDFYYGRSAPKWSITDDATIPCVRYGELYTKHKGTVKEIYSYTNIDRNKLRFSKGGEILIPRVGEDPMDFAKCSYLPFSGIAIGEMISVYNTDQNPVFITAYFNSQMKYEFAKRVEGASVSNLYYSYLKDINLRIPTIEEQQKIGIFFSKLDRQIELEEQKLEKLKEQKKGYMQKIFTQELKFKNSQLENIKWSYKTLEELNSFFTDGNYGESYPKSEDMSDKNDGVAFLRGSNLKKGRITLEDANYISKKKHSELTTGHLFLDDIVIAVRGSLGAVGYVNENMVGNNINSQLAIIRTSNSLLYGKYLLYYLMSNQGKKELLSRVTGTALKQLPIKQIKQIKVPVPKLHEQHKIANFLSELDNLIDNQTEKIELLKERKKGFLQKMFV
ncbi:hypothetical protein BU106_07350 [Staphylococcus xylosus]|uniref:restriction endonuclease subunit S n=1 Tax=Staphylococcus xylosus TaxID=1288 RepID=UPI000D1E3350|nr:restriction endonuclease subunit S [Staphylococcus xylosus]PTI53632.1 hypothetical protein BU106_07350 [Staphylococcus xylosus]